MTRKSSIRLNSAEREVLETLYLDKRIAVDRYQNRPGDLFDLTDSFNAITGRGDPPEDILHYMRTRRKNGTWPKLGKQALKLQDDPEVVLEPQDVAVLEGIYLGLGRIHGKGNDSFAHEPELLRELEGEFLTATGKHVYGGHLLAALTDRRKNRLLERIGPQAFDSDEGFTDIDAAANM